ncbi:hypothetical protein Ahy_A05g025378 [Arachis hypogaea]|uniref:Ubiquitin-like protease family profile domain-containing protein n=1 Tax=Arachis hypogaea TaxID=3818 RepID=A0A445D8I4_ARAHY|nr:hypothetical protein Ahy_A05g025378 [Arachis hypogaea]
MDLSLLCFHLSCQQIALSPGNYCPETLEFIKTGYMGPVDDITKVGSYWRYHPVAVMYIGGKRVFTHVLSSTNLQIYIPLHKDRHWFLMVVDLKEELLIYLDSLKDHSERDARVDQMTYVAFFLQTVLRDRKLYSKCDSVPPMTSAYRVRKPITGQQEPTSMRLALDLIMAKSNPTRDEICKLACKHWEETLDNPATRGTPQGTQPPAEASSIVSSSSKSLTI